MFVVLRYFKALKDSRSLILTFATGELKNRYRNSVLGFFWSILEPLLLLTVLYFVFSTILKPGIPNFVIYLLLGLIVWNFISKSTTMGLSSISNKSAILSNVYFQRAIPALSSNITGLFMLGLEFIIFTIFFIAFGVSVTPTILFLPYIVFLIFIISLGLSLPLSVLNVLYRDVQFIWNIILSAGFFIHPIIYNVTILPSGVREKLEFIPTVRLFNMMHDTVLFGKIPSAVDFVYVTVWAFAILGLGYVIYRIFEPRIAEEI
jgi:lipopolysaccharide transport system permease protein